MKKVVIVGAGIAGLSAAACLARAGLEVTVLEKNDKPGGRINFFEAEGFRFDMGPSWYWMPEVFEDFYAKFGYTTSDFYKLTRLDPSYKIYYKDDYIDVPASYDDLRQIFEHKDPGSAARLDAFMKEAEYKYKVGMEEFVWKPGRSVLEFVDMKVLRSLFRLQMLSSMSTAVSKVTTHDQLRQLLEFPVLFLGATPQDTPALYSLMNHADIKLGTWYPEGGMYEIAKAFYSIAVEEGVTFHFNEAVSSFSYARGTITKVHGAQSDYDAHFVIANADYHHIDQQVLRPEHSQFDDKYWDSRQMAPSSQLYYLGVNRKLEGIHHHNLFFDADFDGHAHQIYKEPAWPREPLFYACAPSVTDASVAPVGMENLFLLMPLAPDLTEKGHESEDYLRRLLGRISSQLDVKLSPEDLVYQKSFSIKDFKSTYNSFKGNAYGLANTLSQTALLKPPMKSRKIHNLYYAGQLTLPGPGLPPAIISGQVAAAELINALS